MPKIEALSGERHAHKFWQRYPSYDFARAEAVTSLVASELPKAIMSLPVAFLQQGDAYVPVAVLGLEPGKNLFVAQNGRWIGQYVPAALRGYPFVLLRNGEQLVMCADEESGLIGDEGLPLFDAEGKPAEAVQAVLDFLVQVEQSRVRTVAACAALARHGCIRPWTITHKFDAENERRIEGLFQIDEAALNALPDEAFLELRRAGALLIAYGQLLSMQHLPLLGQLADAHAKAAAPLPTQGKDIDLSFLSEGEMFKFDGM